MPLQEPHFVDVLFSVHTLGVATLLVVLACLCLPRTRRAIERSFAADDVVSSRVVPITRRPLRSAPDGPGHRPSVVVVQRVWPRDARVDARFDVVEPDDHAPTSTGLEDDLASHLVVNVRVQ